METQVEMTRGQKAYAKNPEKIKARNAEFRNKNKDKINEQKRRKYAEQVAAQVELNKLKREKLAEIYEQELRAKVIESMTPQ